MNKIVYLILATVIAALFAGCTPPANTNTATNVNSNANAKAAAAPPTLAALKEIETKAFEAYKNKDGKFFEAMLDDKFVMGGMHEKVDKVGTIKAISENKCEVKSSTMSDEKMVPLGNDAAVLITKVTSDEVCDGKKSPSPVISATVYVRSGDTWKGAYHNEVAIVDPKAAPASSDKATDAKKEEPKPPAMKEEAKPSNSNAASNSMASNSASNSNASNSAASSTSSDMTAAWLEMEKKGWEAWQKKDAAWFETNFANNAFVVDLFGNVIASKADIIKKWTTDNKCEITSTSVTDATSVSLGKDAGILMYKGSATGTCDGMAVKPLLGTTFLVNEGGSWKAAGVFENPV